MYLTSQSYSLLASTNLHNYSCSRIYCYHSGYDKIDSRRDLLLSSSISFACTLMSSRGFTGTICEGRINEILSSGMVAGTLSTELLLHVRFFFLSYKASRKCKNVKPYTVKQTGVEPIPYDLQSYVSYPIHHCFN